MRRTLALASLLAVSCGDSDGGETGSSASSTGQTDSSGTSGGSTTTTSSGSASSSTTSTTASTSAGTSSGGTSSESGADTNVDSSSEGGGPLCRPGPGDDACRECIKEPCCESYTNCENDEVCACTLECVLSGSSLGSCKSACNGDSELYEALFFCGQMFCLNTCDWDCC